MPIIKYAFDSLGTLAANYIVGERQTVTVKNGYDFHYIIPTYAPFFAKDFKMYIKTTKGTKQYLVEGVDFVLGFRFIQAVTSVGQPVYGAVSFINRQFSGDVYLEYRTIGGDWNIDVNKIQEIIADWQHNPITTTWEQVANLPYQFPPSLHTHPVNKLTTVEDLIAEIRKLSNNNLEVIQGLVDKVLDDAVAKITKANLGLGNVMNLPILPINNGNDNSDNYYVTPRGVRDINNATVIPVITTHFNAHDNPHRVTAEQVDTYTKGIIDNLLDKKLDKTATAVNSDKLSDKTLEELKNYILAGVAADSVKFGGLSYTEVMSDVANRTSNIIQTFKDTTNAQIAELLSTYTANDSLKFGGKTTAEYAAWLLDKFTIDADTLSGSTKADIIASARNNINAVTLNGLSSAQIITQAQTNVNASTLNNKTANSIISEAKTNVNAITLSGKTLDEILVLLKQNLNATTLEGRTKAQIITEAQTNVNAVSLSGKTLDIIISEARTNINATTLNGLTSTQIINSAISSANTDATTLNGSTKQDILSLAKALTVDNSNKLEGKTVTDILAQVDTIVTNKVNAATEATVKDIKDYFLDTNGKIKTQFLP